jgi:hypothetical protein
MPTLVVGMFSREFTCPRQAWAWHPYYFNGLLAGDFSCAFGQNAFHDPGEFDNARLACLMKNRQYTKDGVGYPSSCGEKKPGSPYLVSSPNCDRPCEKCTHDTILLTEI